MYKWPDFKQLRQSIDFAAIFKNCIRKMKSSGSSKQHQGWCLLPKHDCKKWPPSFSARSIWIVPGGDNAGIHCAASDLFKLVLYLLVQLSKCSTGTQSTDRTQEQMTTLFDLGGAS